MQKSGQLIEKKNLISTDEIGRCFFVDSKQRLWIGTDWGIKVYNPESGQITIYNRANSQIPDNAIRSIAEDPLGNIWIGTLGGGTWCIQFSI